MIDAEGTKHLYTTKDVGLTRQKLLDAQDGVDPITGLIIPCGQAVLDHDHGTQFVRAVLHRQSNAVLGKLENMYTRYLSWWYKGTLADFLRGCADYLDTKHPQDYVHPAFVKHLQIQFNKLTEGQKKNILASFNSEVGTNGKQRKELFKKVIQRKEHGMKEILQIIEKEKAVE